MLKGIGKDVSYDELQSDYESYVITVYSIKEGNAETEVIGYSYHDSIEAAIESYSYGDSKLITIIGVD